MQKTVSQINAYELSYSRSKSGRDFWATLYEKKISTNWFQNQSLIENQVNNIQQAQY